MKPCQCELKADSSVVLNLFLLFSFCRYNIMLSCRNRILDKRPKFNELTTFISQILGKSTSKRYIDLNEPYMQANVSRFNSGDTDYSSLMGTPEFQAPPIPIDPLRKNLSPYVQRHGVTLTATNSPYFTGDKPLNYNYK